VASIASSNPNGASVSYTYDDLNRLSTVVDNRLAGNNTTTYTYDPASNVATGNRLSATEQTGRTLNWSYDGIYRLTNEQIANDPERNDGSVSYGLDPVGNRLSAKFDAERL
jgi:hypothetical protein